MHSGFTAHQSETTTPNPFVTDHAVSNGWGEYWNDPPQTPVTRPKSLFPVDEGDKATMMTTPMMNATPPAIATSISRGVPIALLVVHLIQAAPEDPADPVVIPLLLTIMTPA